MQELELVLDEIEAIYCTMSPSKEKHQRLEKLWTSYYQILKEQNLESERGYQLYLLGENESFTIDSKNRIPVVEEEHLRKGIEKIENQEYIFTEEEMNVLLDWAIAHARREINHFGISVENNSLNGFCELGQALTLLPFEQAGFSVTKNTAKNSFGYLWNHAFGTVSCQIQREGKIETKSYLLDATYRQFFTSGRCNEGRYDALEENTNLPTAPDPGYFLTSPKEEAFAKELIEKGYIELTEENAKIYAKGFQKASLLKEEKDKELPEINAKQVILETARVYSLNQEELEEIEKSSCFPSLRLLDRRR